MTTESTLASAVAAVAEEEPADDVAQGDTPAAVRATVGQPLRSRLRRHSSVLNSNKGVTPHGVTAVKPLPGWALTPTTQVGHGSASSAIGQLIRKTATAVLVNATMFDRSTQFILLVHVGQWIAVVILSATPVTVDIILWLKFVSLVSAATFSQKMYPSSRHVVSSILTQFNLQSAQIRNVQATLEAVQHLNSSADTTQLACTTLVYVISSKNSTAPGAHKALVAAASASCSSCAAHTSANFREPALQTLETNLYLCSALQCSLAAHGSNN
eukprot:12604-Heterococcus_DN1.PRE.2